VSDLAEHVVPEPLAGHQDVVHVAEQLLLVARVVNADVVVVPAVVVVELDVEEVVVLDAEERRQLQLTRISWTRSWTPS
jgi:hypothetical protein